jgi:hypothetical protein
MVGVRHRRALFPGFSDTASFDVACPDLRRVKKAFPDERVEAEAPEGSGRLRIRARLLYRKIDQYLLNFMYGREKNLTSPVTEMAFAVKEVRIAQDAPTD